MIKYERIITDDEQKLLEHDLLDITDWINKAIEGKINNCKKRAAIQYREMLKNEGAAMVPANDDIAAKELFKRADYKSREAREKK